MSVPDGYPHPDGEAASELVAAAGIRLEPWQQWIFESSMLERSGRWAAAEVAGVIPRQNGKSELAIARILAGLYVLDENLIIYTAHLADTSLEMFRRLIDLVDSHDWLAREVKHVWRANGKEQIELRSGQRVRFRTRTKGGGRGYAGVDCVIFDEAMIFPEASLGSIYPVVSRGVNPQLWFLGSAVDQTIHDEGRVLSRVRDRGLAGDDPSLAYFEWSLEFEKPEDVPRAVAADQASWKAANPSRMIPMTHIANEQRSLDPRTFAVERLGVGDWFDLEGEGSVININKWRLLMDETGVIDGEPVFAFDVSPDRAWASVCVAGRRGDGLPQVEVAEHRRGTGWVAEWLSARQGRRVICDARGPAGSLIPSLERFGVNVEPVSTPEHVKACGMLYDAVSEGTIRHLGDPLLTTAVAGAKKRPLGDAWAWARVNSSADISPLVGCTLALWGLEQGDVEVWVGNW